MKKSLIVKAARSVGVPKKHLQKSVRPYSRINAA